jgi:putative NADPH-quinone reductase
MRVLVILAHPSGRSFNAALAKTVVRTLKKNKHRVIFHDLYTEKFDPLLPAQEISEDAKLPGNIKKHCAELVKAEGLVIVHPNWWSQPPAILKGWIDRVLRIGLAYDFPPGPEGAAGLPIEMLGHIRVALVLNTSDTPKTREDKVLKDPLQKIWKNTLTYCGVKKFYRKMYRIVVTSTAKERKAWLYDAAETTRRLFPPV